MASFKSINFIGWSLTKESIIFQVCMPLLVKIILQGTFKECSSITHKNIIFSHRLICFLQNLENSRNSFQISQKTESERSLIERLSFRNQRQLLKVGAFFWQGNSLTLTLMNIMWSRDTYTNHSWLINWSLISEYISYYAVLIHFVFIFTRRAYAGSRLLSINHQIRVI